MRFVDAAPLRERDRDALLEARLHADQCPSCFEYFDAAMKLESEISDLPQIAPSGVFCREVVARVAREPIPQTVPASEDRSEIAYWPVMLTGVLALLAGSLLLLRPETWLERVFGLPSVIRTGAIHPTIPQHSIPVWIATAVVAAATSFFILYDEHRDRERASVPRRSR
jgi:hypothetical protein